MYVDTPTLIIIGMWLIAIGVLLVWLTETPKEKAIRRMGTHRTTHPQARYMGQTHPSPNPDEQDPTQEREE